MCSCKILIVNYVKKKLKHNIISNGLYDIQIAGLKHYYPPPVVDQSEWPEQRKLRPMERQPDFKNQKPPKMPKMIYRMRGPELVHNDLIYKGYGVKALLGGRLKSEHFEAIRTYVNKKLDTERMFALWRVDPPWQPVSHRGVGKPMGGGKGNIHHYVSPVKADRIIVEVGGDLEEVEAIKILGPVAHMLPFPARFVSQKMLDDEKESKKWVEKNNKNPFTMEYIIRNNMAGCRNWLSKYDYEWLGEYK